MSTLIVGLLMAAWVIAGVLVKHHQKIAARSSRLSAPEPVTGTGPTWEQDTPWVLEIKDDL